jgi:hypothetical protein
MPKKTASIRAGRSRHTRPAIRRTQLNLFPDQLDQLRQHAFLKRVPVSAILRTAVDEFLRRHRNARAAVADA